MEGKGEGERVRRGKEEGGGGRLIKERMVDGVRLRRG